ncbi:V-type immunoglobulin domain-containing suppressor of T-cell activation isoform X2 [Panthera pardus]|uniref:V-type immunoglobulin domain-containing suppressor of T-cell activation isoform X2 n=1 Tax=Panthera pardus TaxID=9691 RepID=UPI0009054BFD|nr:V-type immunoglobulin domain-containing suppressor of T-cell activation isoform X2 [Panthera pardus]
MAKGHDVTYYKTWYRGLRGQVQLCSERRPIRNLTFQDLHLHHSGHQANSSQDLAQRHGLQSVSDHHGNFSITVFNLTLVDSGLYCCLVVEIRQHHSEQRVHGAIELQVQRDKEASPQCILYPPSPRESESITAAAVATGACIVGILCLPLILLLVYKQRQVASNRRAQELVRMDSSDFLATTLKESKTLALRSLHLPTRCQRPSPGLHCPTWLRGSLRSLAGTCSPSPALLCLHQALGMFSSQPSTPCLTLRPLRPSRPAGASGRSWLGLGQTHLRSSRPSEWSLSLGPGSLPPALSPDSLRYL